MPIAEERIAIEKRRREIGEVLLRRTVTETQQSVTADLTRETLRVTRRAVPARPAGPDELAQAFTSAVRRIPVFGEEAVAVKRPFVTGEVVVHRRPVVERQMVTESVRRAVVETEVEAAPDPTREPAPETARAGERAPRRSPARTERVAAPRGEVVAAPREVVRPRELVLPPVEKLGSVWREVKDGFSRGRSRS